MTTIVIVWLRGNEEDSVLNLGSNYILTFLLLSFISKYLQLLYSSYKPYYKDTVVITPKL